MNRHKEYCRDIAIIGMSCLFPDAPDLKTYWENILSKVNSIKDPPPSQVEILPKISPEEYGYIYCKKGGYLGELAKFDPLKFGVVPSSIPGGDPDHFMGIKLASSALEDAGLLNKDFPRERTAVILGHGTYINPAHTNLLQHGFFVGQMIEVIKTLNPDYDEEELSMIRRQLIETLPAVDSQVITALIPNVMAGVIANRFDLMGPSYVVDAACSSSLIGVDLAIKDLVMERCDIALVGGVQGFLSPTTLMDFCKLGALSRRSEISPFDKDADGTLMGEGVGFIVLRRREDAEKEGDKIYAVIKGTGVASDGKSKGLLSPALKGEVLAMQRAYKETGISPETVELIEAHGTAMPLGDVTEMRALKTVFGERNGKHPTTGIGSVKSMIGHLLPAAGMAGLIKTALALYHKILPPTINFKEPNPELEIDKTPFYVITEPRPWVHSKLKYSRRAGVNSFGFGGINTHCILEERE